MRHVKIVLCLAAGALILSGCADYSASKKPSEPAKTAAAAPMEKPKAPAPAPAAKPTPAPPAPIDKTPITADLSKCKLPTENQELFGFDNDRAFLYTNGTIEATVKVPADGEYEITVNASCDAALNENAKFKLHVDGSLVGRETTCSTTDPRDYAFTASLKAGERKVGVEFTNDAYKENEYDRNLYVHGLKLVRVK